MSKFTEKTGIISSFDIRRPGVKVLYGVCFGILCIMALLCFFPPLWIITSAMKDIKEFFAVPPTIIPRSFHPEKLVETWNKMNFWKYYLNSFMSIGGCVVCAVVFNGLLAYVISKLRPRGSKVVFTLILWSLMVPGTMGLVPLFSSIVDMHLINTFVPLWLIAGANAFYVVLYKNFYDGIPQSLMEAAQIDGCSNMGIFFRIVLPISKAINMVVIIFAINAAWSDFLMPFLVLKSESLYTVMVKIFTISTGNGGFAADQQFIAITFAIIPPLILYLIFQKQIMGGMANSGIKG